MVEIREGTNGYNRIFTITPEDIRSQKDIFASALSKLSEILDFSNTSKREQKYRNVLDVAWSHDGRIASSLAGIIVEYISSASISSYLRSAGYATGVGKKFHFRYEDGQLVTHEVDVLGWKFHRDQTMVYPTNICYNDPNAFPISEEDRIHDARFNQIAFCEIKSGRNMRIGKVAIRSNSKNPDAGRLKSVIYAERLSSMKGCEEPPRVDIYLPSFPVDKPKMFGRIVDQEKKRNSLVSINQLNVLLSDGRERKELSDHEFISNVLEMCQLSELYTVLERRTTRV